MSISFVMYRFFSLLILCIFFQTGFAQIQFKDPSSPYHYQIDFKSQNLMKETPAGFWEIHSKLNFKDVQIDVIPILSKVHAFKFKSNYLLNLDGTGQVYLLDIKSNLFTRLDRTFFAGYNFGAIKYLRNDTLFSLGGSGFWHSNNIKTFFSFKSLEWEMPEASTDASPLWMNREFGGYNEMNKTIFIIEFPPLYSDSKKAWPYRLFSKSELKNNWDFKGKLNVELIKKLGLRSLESIFLNGIFIFRNGPVEVWGDPDRNELYQLNKVLPFFNSNHELSGNGKYFYSYHKIENTNSKTELIKIDSLSLDELKSISIYKGNLYEEPSSDYTTITLIVAGIGLLIIIVFKLFELNKFKTTKNFSPSHGKLDGLDLNEITFIKSCLEYPLGHEFSSQEFTEIMGFSTYAYETQRQVRAKLIKTINFYFSSHFKMDQVILRKVAREDKRYSVYVISEEHYVRLHSLFSKEN